MADDEKQTERLIRENERMRAALLSIRSYAEDAVFGGWRHDVARMATNGLDIMDDHADNLRAIADVERNYERYASARMLDAAAAEILALRQQRDEAREALRDFLAIDHDLMVMGVNPEQCIRLAAAFDRARSILDKAEETESRNKKGDTPEDAAF